MEQFGALGTATGIAVRPSWQPGSLVGTDAVSEAIAAKDLNNLYRAACFFHDVERYKAFCAQYAVMRVIDDRVDDFAARRHVTHAARENEQAALHAWHQAIADCLSGRAPSTGRIASIDHRDATPMLESLARAMQRFPAPATLWHNFLRSMDRDLQGDRFTTYREFLEYADGATVAPTTIFLHLIVATPSEESHVYHPPSEFDILACGCALGRFAYLGHILRDVAEDLGVGDHGLLYLAMDDMASHGVSESRLMADRQAHRTSPPVRALVRTLIARARTEAARGIALLEPTMAWLENDQRLVLGFIVRVYQAVLDKIEASDCEVMTRAHLLTTHEKARVARDVARWAEHAEAL